MYGNREESVLDKDVPEVPGRRSTDDGLDEDALSESQVAGLETATHRVRRAVDALVPDIAEVEAQVTETPAGFGGLVVLQLPGMPPVGATLTPGETALTDDPVLSESEVRAEATDLVAQAVLVAREGGLDVSDAPAM